LVGVGPPRTPGGGKKSQRVRETLLESGKTIESHLTFDLLRRLGERGETFLRESHQEKRKEGPRPKIEKKRGRNYEIRGYWRIQSLGTEVKKKEDTKLGR